MSQISGRAPFDAIDNPEVALLYRAGVGDNHCADRRNRGGECLPEERVGVDEFLEPPF
jgi:hypothetical protein